MDSEDAQREDRFARYVLTGLIVTVCTLGADAYGGCRFSDPVCFAAS